MQPDPDRRALDPPASQVALIDEGFVRAAVAASRESARGRIISPLHKSSGDPLHRMLNVVQPGSYIRPHRHLDPPKAESLVVLRGELVTVIFDESGRVLEAHRIGVGGTLGIDLEAGVIHTFYVEEPDTVVFEVKPGPYLATNDKDFMPWAPEEGTPEVGAYMSELRVRCEASFQFSVPSTHSSPPQT